MRMKGVATRHVPAMRMWGVVVFQVPLTRSQTIVPVGGAAAGASSVSSMG
jgi:hypothetical protein